MEHSCKDHFALVERGYVASCHRSESRILSTSLITRFLTPHPLFRKPSPSPTRRRRPPPHENGGAFDPFWGAQNLPPGAALPDGEAASAARTSSEFSDRKLPSERSKTAAENGGSKLPSASSVPHLAALSRNLSEQSRTETPAGGTSANGMPPLPRIATHKLEGEAFAGLFLRCHEQGALLKLID